MRRTELSVECLNAAFSADTSIFSLMNPEMIKKLKIASIMAFLAWSFVLPSFLTPATLSIYPDTNMVEIEQQVGSLAIANNTVGRSSAFSPPMYSDLPNFADDGKRLFAGPKSIINLISSATSSLGQILPIKAPYNHSTYSIQGEIASRRDTIKAVRFTTLPTISSSSGSVELKTSKDHIVFWKQFPSLTTIQTRFPICRNTHTRQCSGPSPIN